jgi:hypothetical protein
MSLYSEFQQIIDALDREGIPYALCGGLAMAVYELPRATMDIDLLILVEDLEKAKTVALKFGYKPAPDTIPLPAADSQIYRLTKLEYDQMPWILDLLLVDGKLKSIWDSRQQMEWAGGNLSVVSREGLIAMKQLRNSKKDQDDIDFLTSNEN